MRTAGGLIKDTLSYRRDGEKGFKMGKFYIAYGSNLSVEQMAYRCPDAVIAGKGVLKDWKLAFGRHATIEPCEGAQVPVLIWEISQDDEKKLDRYEGYPVYYVKEDLDVIMTDLDGQHPAVVNAMVYIMTEIQKSGEPEPVYYYTIRDGYKNFGFDLDVLKRALWECWTANMSEESV